MISGRDIICIASIEWDFLWQGHQEINLRLARAGNRILYIENTGVRSPRMSEAGRILKRLKSWMGSLRKGGVREVAPNIYVCSPLVFPPFGRRWQKQLNRRFFLPLVRRAAKLLGMRDPIIWTYLPTDTALDLINLLRNPESIIVYYCIADFAQLTPKIDQLRRSEQAILKQSNVVFAQEAELAEHCLQWNENVHIFPFGVNLDAFPLAAPGNNVAISQAAENNSDVPSTLRTLPHPIIGYIGGMHRHVDFRMLAEMARLRPRWSWVFVGAVQADVGELSTLSNVHMLGQQPHYDLVRYIESFDVCIVPYVDSAFTATVVPTKINEYLAVGKPVVSTSIPAVVDFNHRHNILITAPARADEFLKALEQALHLPDDIATRTRRREVASLGNWDTRLEEMSWLIESRMKTQTEDRSTVSQKARASA